MNKRMRLISNLAIGFIVIAVTLVIFFMGFPKDARETLDYAALTFILISEAALFTGLTLLLFHELSESRVLIRSGIISTLLIYWIATVIISLFAKTIFENNVNAFIITQIVLIGIVAIIIISIFLHAAKVQNLDKTIQAKRMLLQNSEDIVISLKNNSKFTLFKSSLDRLYETLKYSDKIVLDIRKDTEISEKIAEFDDQLQNSDVDDLSKEDIEKKIDMLIGLIKERNELTKQGKRGGF